MALFPKTTNWSVSITIFFYFSFLLSIGFIFSLSPKVFVFFSTFYLFFPVFISFENELFKHPFDAILRLNNQMKEINARERDRKFCSFLVDLLQVTNITTVCPS